MVKRRKNFQQPDYNFGGPFREEVGGWVTPPPPAAKIIYYAR